MPVPTPTPSTGRCSNSFHSKPAALRVVYYKRASTELPPLTRRARRRLLKNPASNTRGHRLCYCHQRTWLMSPQLLKAVLMLTVNSCHPVLKMQGMKYWRSDGTTSNTITETGFSSKRSKNSTGIIADQQQVPQFRFAPITIPDCLHLSDQTMWLTSIYHSECYTTPHTWHPHPPPPTPPSQNLQRKHELIHPGAYILSSLTRMLQKKRKVQPKAPTPSPAAWQLKSIPEVTLVNIELALLPTVKFHHNSNNIDNNENNNNNINGKLLILNNSFWR